MSKIREYLTESGPKTYWQALTLMANQLDDMEEQVRSLGGELNLGVGQGLYKIGKNPIVIQMKNLSDTLANVKEQVLSAAKNAKQIK